MARANSIQEVFDNMCSVFVAEKAQSDKATIRFEFSGDDGGKYWVKVDHGTCAAGSGEPPEATDMTILCNAEDWLAVSNGDLNSMQAFMAGKIKVQGNMGLALKLNTWFKIGA
ncbi:MAG TPA: SCP2 sterol-binding domain-containing protein [Aggregatilineales bacterium]|nr:SCP2 sterol-binding domain-containing protein [Aggregatilineales bacterium]